MAERQTTQDQFPPGRGDSLDPAPGDVTGERRIPETTIEATIHSLPAHIAVLDSQGTIISINAAWEQFARENQGILQRCGVGVNYLQVCRDSQGPYSHEAPQALAGLEGLLAGRLSEFALEYPCHSEREQRWFILQAARLKSVAGGCVVSHINITERKRIEQALHESEQRIRAILDTAVDAIVTIDRQGTVIGLNAATERMFGYTEQELLGQNVRVFMPPPYRDEHDEYLTRYAETGEAQIIGKGREVRARRKDGSTFAVDLAVSEVDHLGLFTGVMRDVSDRKRLEREVLQIASEEQRRIGQDLHDGIQQELAGLGLMAQTLAESLSGKSLPEAEVAARLSDALGRSCESVRLLARGLIPVEVDKLGLVSALTELASRTSRLHAIDCTFDETQPVEVADNAVATHLFRITQEAVTNAIKHGHPRTIRIRLTEKSGTITLQILDDGNGIAEHSSENGMGLRIMAYRADLIGATLDVGRRAEGGTAVVCRVAKH